MSSKLLGLFMKPVVLLWEVLKSLAGGGSDANMLTSTETTAVGQRRLDPFSLAESGRSQSVNKHLFVTLTEGSLISHQLINVAVSSAPLAPLLFPLVLIVRFYDYWFTFLMK